MSTEIYCRFTINRLSYNLLLYTQESAAGSSHVPDKRSPTVSSMFNIYFDIRLLFSICPDHPNDQTCFLFLSTISSPICVMVLSFTQPTQLYRRSRLHLPHLVTSAVFRAAVKCGWPFSIQWFDHRNGT